GPTGYANGARANRYADEVLRRGRTIAEADPDAPIPGPTDVPARLKAPVKRVDVEPGTGEVTATEPTNYAERVRRVKALPNNPIPAAVLDRWAAWAEAHPEERRDKNNRYIFYSN